MKLSAIVGLLCLLLSTAAVAGKHEADEKAIRDVVNTFVTAWNKHDVKGLTSVWTNDATAINPAGRRAFGRGEIEKLFTDEHTTFMKTSKARMNVETFRFV